MANQIVNLFTEKGCEAHLVVPADPHIADFLDEPAPSVITHADVLRRCEPNDILIDFWPSQDAWDVAVASTAKRKIFWQHGASVPMGNGLVGTRVFDRDSPYTDQWNVSAACASYISNTYKTSNIHIIHPFFDSKLMRELQAVPEERRKGFLVLARRGLRHMPMLQCMLGDELTVLRQPFHEKTLFQALRRHRFFISIDDGVRKATAINAMKDAIKCVASPAYRRYKTQQHRWIIPKGNLLGFPMPPTEAAWLGCVVIGFAMGGGMEWMTPENCFLAKDANQRSLLEEIDRARHSSEKVLSGIKKNAFIATSTFTKAHTWSQMSAALGGIL